MKYIIKKKNKFVKIADKELNFKGYKFKPKKSNIKSVVVLSPKLIHVVLNTKINEMFTRLLMIVNDAFNSDDNPAGVAIALDEIEMVRGIIRNKYAKYLTKEKLYLYLKKLELIEEEMRCKEIVLNTYKEEKGRGR